MQTTQNTQKHGFRAPPGYGGLKETCQVDPQPENGLESGTLFIHEYERGGKVANLALRGSEPGQEKTYSFIWAVEDGRVTPQGSKLLMQSRPNRKKGESWE